MSWKLSLFLNVIQPSTFLLKTLWGEGAMGFEKLPFNVEVFLFRHTLHKVANCMYSGEALGWELKGGRGKTVHYTAQLTLDLFIKRQLLQVSTLIAFLESVVSQMGFPLRVSLLPQGRWRWLRKPALGCKECCCCWFHQSREFFFSGFILCSA